eukprot:CAMPEP_0174255940 /NCGR_PEP_ID=MMETSP0439-20130205/5217_1 /TAXON_ID=0 /ORGANISM="Stereomyxa ramosa, Strain Chinc5" /LENGTH=171 /DNA_ID=CAMNT_0015338329 /DNA_START=409 /DNA_END=921 /DNA_ORIENTATION=+
MAQPSISGHVIMSLRVADSPEIAKRNQLIASNCFTLPGITTSKNISKSAEEETTASLASDSPQQLSSSEECEWNWELLMNKTVKQLKEICVTKKIRPGKRKKKELVAHMLDILNMRPQDETYLKAQLDAIRATQHTDSPLPHEIYKTHFNSVDLMSRKLYQDNYSYHVKKW